MRLADISALVLLVSAAQAQDSAPANVNDCTFLTDPVQLRYCIDSFELWGGNTILPAREDFGADPEATGSVVVLPELPMRERIQRQNPRFHHPRAPLSPSDKTGIQQIER